MILDLIIICYEDIVLLFRFDNKDLFYFIQLFLLLVLLLIK